MHQSNQSLTTCVSVVYSTGSTRSQFREFQEFRHDWVEAFSLLGISYLYPVVVDKQLGFLNPEFPAGHTDA